MNNENISREDSAALRALSELQKQVTDLAAQRLATSEVLRAIVSSPHDLQPVLQTIVDSAVHLCRAETGAFRLVEEAGARLVAYRAGPALVSAGSTPPMLYERGSYMCRLYENKSPVHIPDFDAELHRSGEADRVAVGKARVGTVLIVPMLRNDANRVDCHSADANRGLYGERD